MYKIILLAAFVLGCVQCSPQANQYFDTVLNTVFPNEVRYSALDPAIMPAFTEEFVDKMKIIGKVKGKVDFTNGQLTGLAYARRYSECQGPAYSFGQKIYNCTITFSNLHVNYTGKMKYGKMPKVNIKGTSDISDTAVLVEVSQNPPAVPVLSQFVFRQAGIQKVKFTGLGPLNKYTKFLDDKFKGHIQAELFNIMNQRVKHALSNAVSKVPPPMSVF